MQLFYSELINKDDLTFVFDKDESRHISKVLRKTEGDLLYITNGKGYIFTGEIVLSSEKKCEIKIIQSTFNEPDKFKIHLAVAPTKMNDRYEWFIEKATEIGIHTITPIICDHSERKIINKERFEKIAQSALKQSLRSYLPVIEDAVYLNEFLDKNYNCLKLIAHCEESDKKTLKNILEPNKDIIVLIGPEGDFSEKEINKALSKNYLPVSLGNTRLRTETAAIVACHSIVFANE